MKPTTALASFAILFSNALTGQAVTIAWDRAYDNRNGSLATVACSDGSHGLLGRFKTFGDLPTFPFIGSTENIEGYNSDKCGSCWEITYSNPTGRNKTVNMLAIDRTERGFVLSLEVADVLTSGQAEHLGRFDGTARRRSASACGL